MFLSVRMMMEEDSNGMAMTILLRLNGEHVFCRSVPVCKPRPSLIYIYEAKVDLCFDIRVWMEPLALLLQLH